MKFFNNIKFFGFSIKGHCKKCGYCCRNITFMIGDKYVTKEEEFERMKSIDTRYNHFYISGTEQNGTLLFTCKSLTEDNLCRNYRLRSLYCRLYPWIMFKSIRAGVDLPEECGFNVEKNIKFKDFLK